MLKFLLGLVSGLVLAVLFGGLLAFLFMSMRSERPTLGLDSVLEVRLAGELPEHQPTVFDIGIFEGAPTHTLLAVRQALANAAEDDRIEALALECGGLEAGWAKAQELRWAIERFRKSGKKAVAYIAVGNSLDYFVCSAADEVYLAPEGWLDVKGFRAEVAFYKGTFDKLGIEAEMVQAGRYKSAVEPYTRSDMSPAFRESIETLLDGILGIFVETVAASRSLEPAALRAALDQGPFLPQAALEAKLVDGVLYEDELREKLKALTGAEEFRSVSLGEFRAAVGNGGPADRIAVLYGVGPIVRGRSEPNPFLGGELLGAESFNETVRELRDDEGIRAVIVRIDSPGGDAIASDLMWRELNLLQEKKPVVVSMGDAAASGGYYMAMIDGAPVVAYPGTITGSIGVFYGKLNLRGLYDKIGITKEIIQRGQFAAIDSDYTPLEGAALEKAQESVDVFYDTFVQKVADAREATWAQIDEVAQGRVWTGAQAQERDLVDQLGGLDEALALAKKAAGIAPETDVRLEAFPRAKTLLETLLEGHLLVAASARAVELPGGLKFLRDWTAWTRGGLLAASPYSVSVR